MTRIQPMPALLTEEALDAFWQVIVRQLPEATTGDLSVERTFALRQAAEAAIREWIANNVPAEEDDHG